MLKFKIRILNKIILTLDVTSGWSDKDGIFLMMTKWIRILC